MKSKKRPTLYFFSTKSTARMLTPDCLSTVASARVLCSRCFLCGLLVCGLEARGNAFLALQAVCRGAGGCKTNLAPCKIHMAHHSPSRNKRDGTLGNSPHFEQVILSVYLADNFMGTAAVPIIVIYLCGIAATTPQTLAFSTHGDHILSSLANILFI